MEIGIRLKEARKANDISLDSLQETTKIQKRYLLAIEQGNLHLLPGKFYARAFIKEYASAVGLDPNEILEDYQDEPTAIDKQNQEMEYSRVQRSRQESKTSKNPAVLAVIPKIIVLLLVIGILITAIYFYNKATPIDEPGQVDQTDGNEYIQNKDNQNPPANTADSVNEDQEDQNDQEEQENIEDQDLNSNESKSVLKLVETGTGSRPESIFELNNTDEKIVLTFQPAGVSWLDVKNDQKSTLLGLNTEADTPIELEITDETRVRINIGNITQLPVILINDIELEYPSDHMTQSFWININNQSE